MSEYVLQLPWPEGLTEADVAGFVGGEVDLPGPQHPGGFYETSAWRVVDARPVLVPRRIELTLHDGWRLHQ